MYVSNYTGVGGWGVDTDADTFGHTRDACSVDGGVFESQRTNALCRVPSMYVARTCIER